MLSLIQYFGIIITCIILFIYTAAIITSDNKPAYWWVGIIIIPIITGGITVFTENRYNKKITEEKQRKDIRRVADTDRARTGRDAEFTQ